MRSCRVFGLALLAAFFAAPATAQTPPPLVAPPATKEDAPRRRASTRTLPATVFGVEPAAVRLTLEGRSAPVSALLAADTRCFRNNRPARPAEFAANEKVTARLQFRSDDSVVLKELWDAPSYAAHTRDRREVCVGTVGTNVAGHLQVRRAGGEPLTFRVTDKTQVRRAGALAKISDYPVGASVAVKPRGLPSGDLMASIIAESAAEVAIAHLDGLVNWEGKVEAVDLTRGHLTLRRSDGAARPLVVAPTARLRQGRAAVQMKDITPGAAVKVHLLRGSDASGLRTADSITLDSPKSAAGRQGGTP